MSRAKNTPNDFWKYVDKISSTRGCWEWIGSKTTQGYGLFSIDYKNIQSHRFSMLLAGYNIEGWHILHSCDNPSCVNPAHLSLGTHTDNMRDMSTKGRHNKINRKNRKLEDSEVKTIRTLNYTHEKLASMFNVSERTIGRIKRCEFYKEVV